MWQGVGRRGWKRYSGRMVDGKEGRGGGGAYGRFSGDVTAASGDVTWSMSSGVVTASPGGHVTLHAGHGLLVRGP